MMNNLINESILKGLPYDTYRNVIKDLLNQGKSTGPNQSEDLLNYSKLNDKRMDRLDKTLKISEETRSALKDFNNNYTFLVISEGWCGDAAQVLPVLNKIAESSSNIDLKIVLRDENEELMNKFLTNNSKSIPKIIVLDSANNVINSWGPRPSIATKMVQDYKTAHGVLDANFKKDLQLWYNKDKGQNTQNDIIQLLKAS